MTNETYSFTLTDTTPNNSYFKGQISSQTPSLRTGEYTYRLTVPALPEPLVLSQGLLQYGDYDRASLQHDKQNKIITYER